MADIYTKWTKLNKCKWCHGSGKDHIFMILTNRPLYVDVVMEQVSHRGRKFNEPTAKNAVYALNVDLLQLRSTIPAA